MEKKDVQLAVRGIDSDIIRAMSLCDDEIGYNVIYKDNSFYILLDLSEGVGGDLLEEILSHIAILSIEIRDKRLLMSIDPDFVSDGLEDWADDP